MKAESGALRIPRVFSDEPLRPDEEAFFQFESYAQTLAALIAHRDTHVPMTVAVQGTWGTGKTTLMRKVQGSLEGEPQGGQFLPCRTVWFEAWRYSKQNEMYVALTGQILKSMRKSGFLRDAWANKSYGKNKQLEQPGFDNVNGNGNVLSEVDIDPAAYQTFNSMEGNGFFRDDFQDTLELLIKEYVAEGRLVIFIDELDRCVPTKVLQVLEAMNLLLHSSVCVFVLGIDIDLIAEAVQACYRGEHQEHISGREYLDKIIQLRFPLPPIPANDLEMYLTSLPDVEETTVKSLRLITQTIPTNPRRIKTFLNHVELQWAILVNGGLSQNLDKACLVEWLILQDRKPEFCEFVKSKAIDGQRTQVFQEMKRIADGGGNHEENEDSPLAPFARDQDLLKIIRQGQFDYTEDAFNLCVHLGPAPSLEATEGTVEAPGNIPTRKEVERAIEQGRSLAMAKLQGADLLGATMQYANLQSINLNGADLRHADLWGANLQKANLQRANLQNVNLQGASVQGANFQGADLRRANLHHSVGLSWTQLKSAASYEGAILPDYLLESRPGEPNTP